MKSKRLLGIWMDHSTAFLLELIDEEIIQNIVESKFTQQEKERSLLKGEQQMHVKEQSMQAGYFKKLSEIIKNFQEVVLFGPTDAKSELLNILRKDHLFEDIKIEVKHSDKMPEKQKQEFVKDYFNENKVKK